MSKKHQSISWKIWINTIKVIVIFSILFTFLNLTIFNLFKDEYIIEQLEKSAEVKSKRYRDNKEIEESNVLHFLVTENNNNEYEIKYERKTAYYADLDILEKIKDEFLKDLDYEGKIRKDFTTHYYYAVEVESGYLIFTTYEEIDVLVILRLGFIVIILGLITLIISRLTAKKISQPLEVLGNFSKEISRRNWSASKPEFDNLEFRQLADTMYASKEALEYSERREREFIQSTSHDLKTPIMIIKGYAQSLIDGINIKNNHNTLEIIIKESERLESKVNKLLQINTLDHTLQESAMDESISLDRLIKRMAENFSTLNTELKWHLSLDPVEIQGNTDSIQVVIENILDNQVRYADTAITITLTETDLSISNDGPSCSLDDPDDLFNRYKQDVNGKHGLGLAIVKKILDAHHMDIHVFNLTKGIEFKINLKKLLE